MFERHSALPHAAFRHAFAWFGFGAKTAVGYGHLHIPPLVTSSPMGETASARPEPMDRWEQVTLRLNPGNGDLTVAHGDKNASLRGQEAHQIRDELPADLQERLKKKRELKLGAIEVEKLGNAWRIVKLIPLG